MRLDSSIENLLLNFVASFSSRLPPNDITNVSDLISKREWGVGLEVLCAQLAEYEVKLSASDVAELRRIAEEMKIDISSFGLVP